MGQLVASAYGRAMPAAGGTPRSVGCECVRDAIQKNGSIVVCERVCEAAGRSDRSGSIHGACGEHEGGGVEDGPEGGGEVEENGEEDGEHHHHVLREHLVDDWRGI
eukprot:1143464-Prymnesium_polylepis.1